jgi:putative spermidine/putrescine transport system ATP-binding protein
MTARDNVEYGLKLKAHKTPSDKREAKSMELLELVGLATHANHYPHQLSGGQQQRIALARALAISPKVLLLDEPLSALDAKVRTQLREEIRRIQLELGTTTLFVTHDQEEALSIADRVGVMRNGILEQIAAPAELYDRPKTAFVAEFVGLTNQIKVSVNNGSFGVFGATLNTLPGSVTSGDGTALIRPELITLKPGGSATVISSSFLGSICRVMANLEDGSRITAQMDAQDYAGLIPGAKVSVAVDNVPVFVK